MADKNDDFYTDGSGTDRPLDSADDHRGALHDLGRRVASLETAPPDRASDAGLLARIERIEFVIGRFFGSELAEFDRQHAKSGS